MLECPQTWSSWKYGNQVYGQIPIGKFLELSVMPLLAGHSAGILNLRAITQMRLLFADYPSLVSQRISAMVYDAPECFLTDWSPSCCTIYTSCFDWREQEDSERETKASVPFLQMTHKMEFSVQNPELTSWNPFSVTTVGQLTWNQNGEKHNSGLFYYLLSVLGSESFTALPRNVSNRLITCARSVAWIVFWLVKNGITGRTRLVQRWGVGSRSEGVCVQITLVVPLLSLLAANTCFHETVPVSVLRHRLFRSNCCKSLLHQSTKTNYHKSQTVHTHWAIEWEWVFFSDMGQACWEWWREWNRFSGMSSCSGTTMEVPPLE